MAVIEAIATTYLEADAALIEFTSIPQTYEHLQLRISARQAIASESIECTIRLGTGGGAVDTGNNYYSHRINGWGTTENSGGGNALAYWKRLGPIVSGESVDAAQYGSGVIDIVDYANTNKNTTALAISGSALGATYSWIQFGSGLWDNAGAVDRIAIAASDYSGDFVRGTEVTLYGLKSS